MKYPLKFNFEGAEYHIEFHRDHKMVPVDATPEGQPLYEATRYPYTTVNIVKVTPSSLPEVFRTYTVGCYHRDRFTLEDGRRAALRGVTKGNSLSKEFKQALWKTYMTRGKA